MGLIGFYIAQGYKIAYMALLGPFWPVGILLKRYNEVILSKGPLGDPGLVARSLKLVLQLVEINPAWKLPQLLRSFR